MHRTRESASDGEPVPIHLTADERSLLGQGVLQWTGGQSRPTEAIAHATGYRDVSALNEGAEALWKKISAAATLTAREWTQAQLLTEIAWASDLIGAGVEWEAVTEFTDAQTATVLRELQRKLIHFADPRLL